MVISLGTLMYMAEGQEPGTEFVDIPTSIYWAVVTMTTEDEGTRCNQRVEHDSI